MPGSNFLGAPLRWAYDAQSNHPAVSLPAMAAESYGLSPSVCGGILNHQMDTWGKIYW